MAIKKIKLFHLLSKIPPNKIKLFEDFLTSPFFKIKNWQLELWFALKDDYPHFNKQIKEEIWANCPSFSQKDFNSSRLNEYFAEMSKQVQEFLKMLFLSTNTSAQESLSYGTAAHFDLPKWYLQIIQEEDLRFSKKKFLSQKDYKRILSLYDEVLNDHRIGTQLIQSNIARLHSEALDNQFILSKLKQALPIIRKSKKTGKEYQINLFNETLDYLKQDKVKNPLILLYRELILLCLNWNEEQFKKAVDLYFFIANQLNKEEQFFLLVQFGNLTAQRTTRGESHIHYTQFLLYENGVKNGVYKHPARLLPRIYTNICNSGAIAQQETWTLQFIKEHHQYLPIEERAHLIGMAKARVAFHMQKYDKATGILRTIKSQDISINLNIRAMSVRCLLYGYIFEQIPYKVLIAETMAFKRFLQRRKNIELDRKQSYTNMLHAATQIANLKLENWKNAKNKEILKQKIIQKTPMVAKIWMVQLLEEN